MPRSVADVLELAAEQWGMFTTAQAVQRRIPRARLTRMVDDGLLERPTHGVYAVSAAVDEYTPIRASWLSLEPTRMAAERLREPTEAGVVSHTSAAELLQLGDLPADVHEFTLPRRYQASREGLRVHRGTVPAQDLVFLAGLPMTTPTRTIADLILTRRHDPSHVRDLVDAAAARSDLDPERLRVLVERRPHGMSPAVADVWLSSAMAHQSTPAPDFAGQILDHLRGLEVLSELNLPPMGALQIKKLISELERVTTAYASSVEALRAAELAQDLQRRVDGDGQ
ncbi:type IV toxin-antitoxin system AbiEi family antitoxin domain-containing protein [Cellulomonas denverensis]|uniref:AbiEi antitoxin N-terminal domain-containing protein n=1 Tax=Cellulomonas denverensis TaxID=264297 RepID=A0A7X6QZJ7_9CELL|nr:type IV toxin-antitoxin system AbiEi family antitoxin domain-containing protein [Cellulomonas denverensis]NKY23182.1 hypothetical protein [Cellulomonas denverensis]